MGENKCSNCLGALGELSIGISFGTGGTTIGLPVGEVESRLVDDSGLVQTGALILGTGGDLGGVLTLGSLVRVSFISLGCFFIMYVVMSADMISPVFCNAILQTVNNLQFKLF